MAKMGKVSFSYSTCKFWYHPHSIVLWHAAQQSPAVWDTLRARCLRRALDAGDCRPAPQGTACGIFEHFLASSFSVSRANLRPPTCHYPTRFALGRSPALCPRSAAHTCPSGQCQGVSRTPAVGRSICSCINWSRTKCIVSF